MAERVETLISKEEITNRVQELALWSTLQGK